MVLKFFSRPSCPHPQRMKEATRSESHLRTLSVPARPSGPHPQRMEEAARLPSPRRKARPTSYFQQGRLNPGLKGEAARSVSHFRTHFPTMSLSVPARPSGPHCRLMEEAGQLPIRKASPTSYLQPSCLRSEPKEAGVPLANPHQPSHPTAHLQQHCAHSEPAGEGVRHLAPRRTMNSTLNSTARLSPSCLRSAPMEEAAQLASHPYWAPS